MKGFGARDFPVLHYFSTTYPISLSAGLLLSSSGGFPEPISCDSILGGLTRSLFSQSFPETLRAASFSFILPASTDTNPLLTKLPSYNSFTIHMLLYFFCFLCCLCCIITIIHFSKCCLQFIYNIQYNLLLLFDSL